MESFVICRIGIRTGHRRGLDRSPPGAQQSRPSHSPTRERLPTLAQRHGEFAVLRDAAHAGGDLRRIARSATISALRPSCGSAAMPQYARCTHHHRQAMRQRFQTVMA